MKDGEEEFTLGSWKFSPIGKGYWEITYHLTEDKMLVLDVDEPINIPFLTWRLEKVEFSSDDATEKAVIVYHERSDVDLKNPPKVINETANTDTDIVKEFAFKGYNYGIKDNLRLNVDGTADKKIYALITIQVLRGKS